MNRNQPNLYELPTNVGSRPLHPLAVLAAVLVVVIASAIATQLVAGELHDNPTLGRPLAHLAPLSHAFSLYAPWAWIAWLWTFCNPLSGGGYPPDVYRALGTLPYTIGAGLVVALVVLVAVDAALSRRGGKVDELTDSAHLATEEEVTREGLLSAKAGPIIGGYDTRRGTRPLRYDGELGIQYTGPPGDGKTSSFLKPNLLIPLAHADCEKWTEGERRAHPWGYEPSIVALDIRGHLSASTSRYQAEVLGKQIFLLEPLGAGNGLARYNPFWRIRIGTPFEADDCYQATLDIVDQDGKQLPDYWSREATAFGAACIAKLGYRALHTGDYRSFSLPGLVEYISSFGGATQSKEEAIGLLVADMLERPDDPHGVFSWNERNDETYQTPQGAAARTFGGGRDGTPTLVCPWIASAARAMGAKSSEERSGVYGSFISFLAIYRGEMLKRNASESTFSFRELANGPRPGIVYLRVAGMKLDHLRPYLRIVTRTAIRELTESSASLDGRETRANLRTTIIALDEVAAMRRVDELDHSGGFLRGHGVQLWLLWQSVQQLVRNYGQNETLSETLAVHIFGRPMTHANAVPISTALGQFSAVFNKRNTSGDRFRPAPLGHVQDLAEIQTRALMTPGEVQRLPKDRTIVFLHGLKIYARKWFYFRNPLLRKRARLGSVERSDVMSIEPQYLVDLRAHVGEERFRRLTSPAPEWEPQSSEFVQAEAIVERLKTLGYETTLTALKTPLEQALEELQQLGYAATLTQNGAPSGDENLDTESGFGVGERADAQDVFARAILEEAT